MQKITFLTGQYYHLYNRGVNRQPIFFNDANWGYFIERLRYCFRPDLIDVVAYCLMPNHYHLLVCLKDEQLGKRIMQPFTVSYSKSVNRQQGRVGPLFQGPFRAKSVDKDEYLVHLSRYIHLNPVLAGLAKRPEEWIFSSYRDYIGERAGTLARPHDVLGYFPSRKAYAEYVESYCETDVQVIEQLMLD